MYKMALLQKYMKKDEMRQDTYSTVTASEEYRLYKKQSSLEEEDISNLL